MEPIQAGIADINLFNELLRSAICIGECHFSDQFTVMNPVQDKSIPTTYTAVSPRDYLSADSLRSVSQPDNFTSVLYVLNHVFWLSLTGVALFLSVESENLFTVLISYLAYCTVFNFLSTTGAMHEFCHGRVFSSRVVNQKIYRALGYLTWTNASLFTLSHTYHHKNFLLKTDMEAQLGNANKTTVLQAVKLSLPDPVMLVRICYFNTLTMLGIFKSENLQQTIRKSSSMQQVRLDASLIFLFHGAVIASSWMLSSWYPFILLTLPRFCGRYLCHVLAASQHNVGFSTETTYNQLSASVSVKTPTLIRMLYWNMNYHAEHHLCPAVPHHRLPQFAEMLSKNKEFLSEHNSSELKGEISGQFIQR